MRNILRYVLGLNRKETILSLTNAPGNLGRSQKTVVFMALATLITVGLSAQTNTSTGTGDWSNASSWDLGHIPAGGEDVVIQAGHVISLDVTTNQLNSIDILGELKGTVATRVVNVTGNVMGDGIISTASQGVTITYDFDGDWTFSGTGPNGNSNRTALQIDATGDQTLNGSLAFRSISVNKSSGTLYVTGSPSGAAGVTLANGNIAYSGAGAQTLFPVLTYPDDLSLSGSGAKTMTGIENIAKDFSMSGSATATTNFMGVDGNISITGTAVMTNAGNNLVLGTLTVGTGATLSLAGSSMTISGATAVDGTVNTVTAATGTKTFTGTVTINAGGVWDLSGQNPETSFGSTITMYGTTFNNGSGAAQVTAPISFMGNTNMTFGGALTIPGGNFIRNFNTGTVSIGNIVLTGDFTQRTGSTLSITGSGFSGAGAFDASTFYNTVNYSGAAAQTVHPVSYANLGLSGSGAKTMTGVTTVLADFSMSGSATAYTDLATVGGNVSITGTAVMTTGAALTVTGALTVGTGATLSLGGFALTTTGATAITGTVNTVTSATGTKTFTGAVTINAGGVWDLSGQNPATSFAGGITNNGTTFNNGTGAADFSATQALAGTVMMTFGGSVTPAVSTTLNNNSSGTVSIDNIVLTGNFTQGAAATLSITGSGISGAGILDASTNANVVNYSGAAQTVKANAYSTLNLSGSGDKTFAGSTDVSANFNMSGSATATTDLATVGGNVSITGTAVMTTGAALAVTGTMTVGTGATLSLGGFALTTTGATAITGTVNTVTSATGTKTFTGAVTINAGGVWDLSGQNPATSFGGGIANNGSFNNGTGAAAFSATQSLTGTVAMTFGGSVTPAGSTTLTNNCSAPVSIDNIVLTGNFTQAADVTLKITGSGISGAGTLDASTNDNVVDYTGAAQTVKANAYSTLNLSGSGAKTFAGSTDVSANFNMSGSATATTDLATVGGNVSITDNASMTTGADLAVTGDLAVSGNATVSMGGYALTVTGTTAVTGGGTVNTVTSGAGTKTFTGAVSISAAATWDLSGQNPATSFGGGITNDGSFNNGTGAAAFSADQALAGAAEMTFGGSVTPAVGTTLTNNSGATVLIGNIVLTGNFTQSNGVTLKITGSGISGAGTFDASTTVNTVVYSGAAQTVFSTDYQNLIIDQSSDNANLGGETVVLNTLTLTNGSLDLGNYELKMGASANAVAGSFSNSRMIITSGSGAVHKLASSPAAANYTFPIGTTGEYSPISLTFTSGTFGGNANVKVTAQQHPDNNSANYLARYWTVAQTGYSGFSCDVVADYVDADVVGTESSIATGQWTGAIPWTKFGLVDDINNEISATVTSFSDFSGIDNEGASVSITTAPVSGIVCVLGSVTLTAVPEGNAPFTYAWSDGMGFATTAQPSTASVGTSTYTVTITDGNGYTASATTSITVVADPVSKTIDATYSNGTIVCVGADVSATFMGGSGGTGVLVDEYQYTTDGTTWADYTPADVITASTTGTDVLGFRTRRTATGEGCGTSNYNYVLYDVAADPVAPTATTEPDNANPVCPGVELTLTDVTDNGGGAGTCVIEYSSDGGTTWGTTLTPITAVYNVVNEIKIRKNCDGSACDISSVTTYTWNVSQPSTADAGIDQNTCEGGFIEINGTVGGLATTGVWSDGDVGGYFDNPNNLSTYYFPPAGLDDVTVILTPDGTCATPDTLILSRSASTLTATLSATADKTSARCGDIVTVEVQVTDGFDYIGAMNYSVNWDTTQFKLLTVTADQIDGLDPSIGTYPAAPGSAAQLGYAFSDYLTGHTLADGSNLLTFTFKVVSSTGTGTIDISDDPTIRSGSTYSGCEVSLSSTNTASITFEEILVTCPTNYTALYCPNAVFTFTGGTPDDVPGVYTGDGVVDNVFTAADAGDGIHTITYTYTDAAGDCSASCTFNVEVGDIISPTATNPAPVSVVCFSAIPLPDETVVTDEEDNCSVTVSFVSDDVTSAICNGAAVVVTRTYRVEDGSSNSIDVYQTITVTGDVTAPTASNPATESVECFSAIPLADETVVTDEADNCDGSVTVTFVSDDITSAACDGDAVTVTRTYHVEDCAGNSIDVTQTITVVDNTPPTASNPTPESVQCFSAIPAPDVEVVTDEADNCDGSVTVTFVSDDITSAACDGDALTVTRTYNVEDCAGNSIDVYQTINVLDVTPPTASNPATESVVCFSAIPLPDETVVTDEADNCDGSVTVTFVSDDITSAACDGDAVTVTRTYHVEDCAGNSIDVTQTINVSADVTAPTASNPAPVSVECFSAIPLADETVVTDEADNCTGTVTVTFVSDDITSAACDVTVLRTYHVQDCAGNSINVTQTIVVERLPFTDPTDAGSTVACAALAVTPTLPTVTDNCGNTLTPSAAVTGGTYVDCEGTITYTYTYTDCAGNTNDWVYTYTIERLPFTNPTDAGSTVACAALAVAPTTLPTVTDNCGNTLTPTGPVTGGTYVDCEGTIMYTYTYTDCAGNTNDWVYTYTIERLPFTNPTDDGSTVACAALAVTPTLPTVTDNCGNTLTPSAAVTGGTYVDCEGTITYTYTYTDCEGNTNDWVYTYTIERLPFTNPTDAGSTVACAALAVAPTTLPTVTDNCGNTLTPTGPVTGGTYVDCEGTIMYTYTYTDCAGNTNDWVYTYTIERLPFTNPTDAGSTVACAALAVAPTLPTVTDNCGNTLTPSGPVTGGTYVNCEGTKTYTYTYTDCEGNTNDWVYTYTIDDTTAPTASSPANMIKECFSDIDAPNVAVVTDEADNCTGSVTVTFVSDDVTSAGCDGDAVTVTRTYHVEDCAGNSIDVTQTIYVDDVTVPTASNPATVNVECFSAIPAPNVAVVTDEADNCDGSVTVTFVSDDITSAVCDGASVTVTRTYHVQDCSGNFVNVQQTINVDDITAPTASNPVAVNIQCFSAIPASDVAVVTDEADNCTGTPTVTFASESNNGGAGSTASPYVLTRTYHVEDCSGNSINVTQTITVVDNTAPVITVCPTPLSVNLPDYGECNATLSYSATATDNCGTPTFKYYVSAAEISFPYDFPAGATTVVTATASDAVGNTTSCTFSVAVNACTFISGKLIWEGNRLGAKTGVANAVVTLSVDDNDTYTTGPTNVPYLGDPGNYKLFADMGSNYTITPVKNRPLPGSISGLTSADASRIQQHVAGIFLITDPYKLLAADCNGTNTVTTADATRVQQAVLGNPVDRAWFAANTWRFVPESYVFPNSAAPWSAPTSISVVGSASSQNFIGIKMGDVNSTASPASAPGLNPNLVYKVQDRVLEQGATFTTVFNAYNFDDLLALQFGLQFDQTKLKFLGVETISGSPMQSDNFGLYDIAKGEIRAFLSMAQSKSLSNGTQGGFRLKFQVLQGGNKLSEVLQLSEEVLHIEAYSSSFRPGPISLEYENVATGTIEHGTSNLSLLQNVPNPFKTVTSIGFVLPETCDAQVRIFDISGRLIEEQGGTFTKGFNQLDFRLDGYSGEGVLYYEFITPYGILSKKMMLVRE